MGYHLDLTAPVKQKFERLSDKFYGKDPNGNEITFTNYFMELNGRPFFGISGECHFSRVNERQWDDTILKMKMGGINIVSTYIFWNHHEEVEGTFRFDGCRNIRKFIRVCEKHGMYVIVRIGPFDHGEVRNGGLPDWLYGKPFEVRSLDEGFLQGTRRLYAKLAEQFQGLYYQDGGPIIGTQIENEYMHSAAPWEMTTGVSNEWLPGGHDGIEYMKTLKSIAQEVGICTPFYTCTGWGKAATPTDEMLPLWGGYAFWPWIFYDYDGEHPLTPEYIYRDNHNNEVRKTYNFEPTYEPESRPYACCEMGGGMACYYNYRFLLPYESVDAMANIKLAGGCNFLGYYMYRGGSNPKGEKTPYLNECQCPKISYDYQAAIGEFGQLRPSYYRLKALHIFTRNFQEQLCKLVTVLPEGSQEIKPEDVRTLRFAARTDGKSGFLFLNNYQDHAVCEAKKDEEITLELPDTRLEIKGISLAAGEEAILPFGMKVGGYHLRYAKAQPLSVIKEGGKCVYFFFMPEGMTPEYVWETTDIDAIDGKAVTGDTVSIVPEPDAMSIQRITGKHGLVEIVTLTRAQSLMFYEIEVDCKKTAVLSNRPFIWDGTEIRLESAANPGADEEIRLLTYPPHQYGQAIMGDFIKNLLNIVMEDISDGIWSGVAFKWEEETKVQNLEILQTAPSRFTVKLPPVDDNYKDALLQIDYRGDIGHAFIDGELVSDNFSNHAVWEIGLHEVKKPEMGNEMVFAITPLKENVKVDVSSTMAGRMEKDGHALAELRSVKLRYIREIILTCSND